MAHKNAGKGGKARQPRSSGSGPVRAEKKVQQTSIPAQLWGLSPGKLALLAAVITLLVYLRATRNDFVRWDDPEYTYENPYLKNFDAAEVFHVNTHYMGNYHPLTLAWYYMESRIFGFDPFLLHLNNILLHIANTVLLFYIILLLIERRNTFVPLCTAVLFGIHPMHVESVAWISELKDVLYTLFFFLGLLTYFSFLERKKMIWLVLTAICYILSLLSKGQAVVFPLVLVLIDWYKRRGFDWKSIAEKIPFFALSVYFGLLAIKAQQSGNAINADYQGLEVLFYGSFGLFFYIYKLLLPFGLSGAHPYPFNPVFETMPGSFKIYPLALLVIFGLLLFWGRKRKYVWFGIFFFLSTIAIVLKLIPVGDTIVAERYTYIPYTGLFFILASFANEFIQRKNHTNIVLALSGACVLYFGILSVTRIGVWKNTETFWSDVNAKYTDYWRGYNNRAEEFEAAGEDQKAAEYYRLAIDRDKYAPPIPYLKLGSLLQDKLNEPDQAIELFRKATEFPNKTDELHYSARVNLANALLLKGRGADALKSLEGIDLYFKEDAQVAYLRGRAHLAGMNTDSALLFLDKAIELSPEKDDYFLKRGILYTDRLNEPLNGIEDFTKALALNPQNLDALLNLGVANYKAGKPTEAIERYSKYIQINPVEGRVYMLRALAYGANGEPGKAYTDAMEAAKRGVNMDPNLVEKWRVGG